MNESRKEIEELVRSRDEARKARGADIFVKCREFKIAEIARRAGLYPYFCAVEECEGPVAVIEGKSRIMLGAGSYLGLSQHPEVKRAAAAALEKYGTSTSGSRFLGGTFELHRQLEEQLAKFLAKEDALIFSTGYQANLGVISTLVGSGEYVVMDRFAHMSIQDGARLSGASVIKFEHNDMEDLEKKLKSLTGAPKLIAVDGVYSMEGDLAPLPEIIALASVYGGVVLVDDVHSLGVLGPSGRGTAAHFGLTEKVDVITGTFSKALASVGGFVASRREVVDYIRHFANPVIFSASLPPASIAAVIEALRLLMTEDDRRARVLRNAEALRSGLRQLGFDTGASAAAIVPVVIGEDLPTAMMWKALFEEGVFTDCVIFPAVPRGRSMLRTSCRADHTDEHINRALEAFEKVGKAQGLI